MTREGVRVRCPESVLGWIPWYGETEPDGSPVLTPRQRGAVQAHAAQCPDCRSEIDMISGAPFEIDVELPDPDRVFEEISERIAADAAATEDSATPVIPIDRGRRLGDEDYRKIADWVIEDGEGESEADASGRLVAGPWVARPVWAAAAAVVLMLLGGLGGSLWSGSDDVYSLAAATPTVSGPRVEVVFRGDASIEAVAEALRAAGGEIAEGPSAAGVFRIRPLAAEEGAELPADAAAVLAERLEAIDGGVVLFAEAVRAP